MQKENLDKVVLKKLNIEDTADVQILKGKGRPKKGVRTLNI